MLILDFKQDWKEYLVKKISDLGFKYNQAKSLEENTITYFNFNRRLLGNQGRKVHESKEFRESMKLCAFTQYENDYKKLKKLISSDGDLKPYLSRQIRHFDFNDSQLNEWGITHLHLSAKGTKEVLFVKFNDTDAYIIQILPHGTADTKYVWVNTQLVEILHNNWPEIIASSKNNIPGEHFTIEQRDNIRKQHGNTSIMIEGTNYNPPGGGLLSDGRCIYDLFEKDDLMKKLKENEEFVKMNENNFRKCLNISADDNLSIKLMFDDQECWLYEPDRKIKFNLVKINNCNV